MTADAINFRATSGFATDSANETYSLGAAYPETRNGVTFGWDANLTGSSRDRGGSSDHRLVGIVFKANGGGTNTFRVDLPNGTGSYTIHAAFGDMSGAQVQNVSFKDGGTSFATLSAVSTGTGIFADASGATWVDTGWSANNVPISHTFTSTTFEIAIGGAGSGATTIAHISFVGGGGAAAPPKLGQLIYALQ